MHLGRTGLRTVEKFGSLFSNTYKNMVTHGHRTNKLYPKFGKLAVVDQRYRHDDRV